MALVLKDEKKILRLFLGTSVVLAMTTAVVPFWFLIKNNAVPLQLCLPFVDPKNSLVIIQVLSWLAGISQALSSALVVGFNFSIAKFMIVYKETTTGLGSAQKSYKSIFQQLAMVTVSNVLCWFPTSALYISAMFLTKYPIDLVTWAAVCVTPINSIVNPLIFNYSKYKQRKRKAVVSRILHTTDTTQNAKSINMLS